jgi:hypothetical protein
MRQLKVLELCSGGKSFTKACEKHGMICTTVDISPKNDPTICADVRTLTFPKGEFDIIWASPPCQNFSNAKTRGKPRDLELADSLVLACLRIISEVQPMCFIIENPMGLLRKRPYMSEIAYATVDYCMYGAPYRKRTDLFMSANMRAGLKPLLCNKLCGQFNEHTNRHLQLCQQGKNQFYARSTPSLAARHSVPELLCSALAIIAAWSIFSVEDASDGGLDQS